MLTRIFLIALCLLSASASAADYIDARGIPGRLFIVGGGAMPEDMLEQFVRLAGGKDAKLVVVPTASEKADDEAGHAAMLEPFTKLEVASAVVMHTRDRDVANSDEFLAPLREATGVWFGGGSQSLIAEAYVGTKLEEELLKLAARDGLIGGTSAGAAIQSRLMIASGNAVPVLKQGFDLLPDAVIDQHFAERNRKPRLVHTIDKHRDHFGLGIDESTAVVVRGRQMRVLGTGNATVILPEGAGRPQKEIVIKAGGYADLTAFRRTVRDRNGKQFPSDVLESPHVKNGALLIVGGGGLTGEMVDRFVEHAGGKKALIAILPISSTQPGSGASMQRYFAARGATNTVVLEQRTRDEVESEEFLSVINKAGGVWFGGGRQWHFMDAYESTKAEAALHGVLARGGIMGGSSAGASIQAEYMLRGSPLGNTDMMADGYERGLNVLPGAAVDQHFSQRGRLKDMEGVMQRFPQLLGIGIDETTAILVEGTRAEIMGPNVVSFYESDSEDGDSATGLKRTVLPGGTVFDFATRRELTGPPPLPEKKPTPRPRPRPRPPAPRTPVPATK
ncbi:MAG: cyanophycinase [Planctomycetota bacterium]|nr:cyanophycinase [Planctomycetota bacterium]MDA1250288.1 cyanophycinase [Planctomycetota bacterium]